jgi:hypothetical protein
VTLLSTLALSLLQFAALYLGATFLGDIVHGLLHVMARSRVGVLRAIGALHEVHHQFLGPDLRLRPEFATRNLLWHRLPEYLTQALATSLGFLLPPAWIPAWVVVLVLAAEAFLAVLGTVRGGIDSNHTETPLRDWSYAGVLVGPLYHLQHHIFPTSYLGSTLRLFDILFATGCQIRGRRFAVTGASGAFGAPLCRMLEKLGGAIVPLKYGRDWAYGDYARLDPVLAQADVLVLCHGSKVRDAMAANCDSFVAIVERFRAARRGKMPVEVWAMGSEIELHPAWGDPDLAIYLRSKRAFARHAKRYFHDGGLLYRHIVPSGYTSPMGKGLISGETAAAIAMFFLRRGFRYVPVTYTGIALLNWPRYLWPPRREGELGEESGPQLEGVSTP